MLYKCLANILDLPTRQVISINVHVVIIDQESRKHNLKIPWIMTLMNMAGHEQQSVQIE